MKNGRALSLQVTQELLKYCVTRDQWLVPISLAHVTEQLTGPIIDSRIYNVEIHRAWH